MSKKYKVFLSVLALVFSIGATGIGFGLVGSSTLSFEIKLICNFFFLMQAMATGWVVMGLFRNETNMR